MEARLHGFPFRWFLPVTQLCLCISILWPYSSLLQGRFWSFSGPQLIVPPALNIPVLFAQLPYIIANPDKTEWIPGDMPFEMWRAVSWPFVGSVFWWLAGRGVEGLSAALRRRIVDPKIGWIEVTVSLAVFALGGIAFLGLISEVHADQLTIALAMGSGLWMMLGAVTVAAKVLQWRLCF